MESTNKAETTAIESENKALSERLSNYFRKAVFTTVDRFLSLFSFSLFKVCYHEIHAKNPIHLKDIHEQLLAQLKSSINDDLNILCKERKVFPSLLSLDAVINQYKDKVKENSWRPSGSPEEDLRDHIYELKLKHKKRLQELLDQYKAENKLIEDTMLENSKVIMNLKKEIDDQNSQLKKNFESIEDFEHKEIEEFNILCNM